MTEQLREMKKCQSHRERPTVLLLVSNQIMPPLKEICWTCVKSSWNLIWLISRWIDKAQWKIFATYVVRMHRNSTALSSFISSQQKWFTIVMIWPRFPHLPRIHLLRVWLKAVDGQSPSWTIEIPWTSHRSVDGHEPVQGKPFSQCIDEPVGVPAFLKGRWCVGVPFTSSLRGLQGLIQSKVSLLPNVLMKLGVPRYRKEGGACAFLSPALWEVKSSTLSLV
jgi:hypothetical protein